MNNTIIDEFSQLILFIKNEIKKNKEEENKKELNVNNFRLRQMKNIFKILKNYPDKITISNYQELKNVDQHL